MPTYLYCLVPAAEPTEPPVTPRGIGGGAVRVLPVRALEAWVSTIPTSSLPATVEAVREHDAVVSAALATGRTPLPARFGQAWPSDADCVASIGSRADELEPMLRRVAGLVEMTVCASLPGSQPLPRAAVAARGDAAPGSAYLRSLRARRHRERQLRTTLEALRARVSGALASLSRGEVAEIRGSDEALSLSVSYLVERSGEAHFRRTVDELARGAEARLVVAGPRAPYSFAPADRRPSGEATARSAAQP